MWMIRTIDNDDEWGEWFQTCKTYRTAMGIDAKGLLLFLLKSSDRDLVVVGNDVYSFRGFKLGEHYRWIE